MASSHIQLPDKAEHLKHFVIAGCGPAAMITAIYLTQKGKKNITMIDPRAGEFTRSGDYVPEVFDEASKMLGFKIEKSYARHIKDLERSLYHHITTKLQDSINIIKGSVVAIEGKNLSISANNKTYSIPCDIAADCTGTSRVLIRLINNKYPSNPPFNIEEFVKVLIKPYLMVRARMDNTERMSFNNTKATQRTSVRDIKNFEKLYELGWSFEAAPQGYINTLNRDRHDPANVFFKLKDTSKPNNKVNIYLDSPENLKPEKYEAWANAAIAQRLNLDSYNLIPSNPKKNTFSYFYVNPQITSPFYYAGNTTDPMIFPVGDSLLNIVFKSGMGIRLTLKRIAALVDTMEITNGEITKINLGSYLDNIKPIILQAYDIQQSSEQITIDRYSTPKVENQIILEQFFISATPPRTFDAMKVTSSSFAKRKREVSEQIREKALDALHYISHPVTGIDLTKLNPLQAFQDCLNKLQEAMSYLREDDHVEKEKIEKGFLEMADMTLKLGNYYHQQHKGLLAKKYITLAKDIHSFFLFQRYPEKAIVLYSQLMDILITYNNPDLALLVFACATLNVIPAIKQPEENLIVLKMTLQKTQAQLAVAETLISKSDERSLHLATSFLTIARLQIDLLQDKASRQILLKKLDHLNHQILEKKSALSTPEKKQGMGKA